MTGNQRQYGSMRLHQLPRKEYFEGWYYKQVTRDRGTVLCLIPGLSIRNGKASPFMQVNLARKAGDGWQQTADWQFYPEYSARHEPFLFRVGGNSFRRDGFAAGYRGERLRIEGELGFSGSVSLPVTGWAPTIMGPFSYLPGMECIHSVISLSHEIRGSLQINGEPVDFSGGKGYIEKDWGSSFPRSYIWLQSNHFAEEGCLFFSWADIPVAGAFFKGYIAHLYYQGTHHRYATYTRGDCKLKVTGQGVEIRLTNGTGELSIRASQSPGAELAAPYRGGMVHTIKEGLFGEVSFCLRQRGSPRELCDSTGLAGVELVFDKGVNRA